MKQNRILSYVKLNNTNNELVDGNEQCSSNMGGRTFFKVGGTSARHKTIEHFCGWN